jgi:hypothetical protein
MEYYNHASGDMIPILSEGGLDKRKSPVVKGSSEKGKSLVATGSLGKGKYCVEMQNPDSFSSNEENVPSKFPISMDIAKTIYNRVGRKMSLFTSKMMDRTTATNRRRIKNKSAR